MQPALELGIMRLGAQMKRTAELPTPPGMPEVLERARPVWRRSMAPHHRRRRAVALILLLGVVAVPAILLGSGGGSVGTSQTAGTRASGFLARIGALAGSGPGSLSAREAVAENAAIDRTLAYTPWIRIAGDQHREIALTFDDGPGPYTPEILSILERDHVPATFFEVGVLERYFDASTDRIVADGDAIGDHTETHAPMSKLPVPAQRAQLLDDASAIEAQHARFPRLFRPPYGVWNSVTLALLHRYRMLMVLWTVDTNDYRRPGVQAIVRAAVNGARPGAIILLHDAGGNRAQTAAALPRIIAALRRQQYQLVTVPRLLLDNPAPSVQNIAAVIGAGG